MSDQYHLVAQTFSGLEDILAEELRNLGAETIEKRNRAVGFAGGKELMYKACLHLRTATRVQKQLFRFSARNEGQLYKGVFDYDWPSLLDLEHTFAINSTVSSEFFKHSKYAALKAKDAIADRFRKQFGLRPSVNTANPHVRIHLLIFKDRCTVYLDASGDSLHRRGYRLEGNIAPLNEVTAAGLVILSGWDKKSPLLDPMCGSGTIVIEAAMLANNIAPGLYRERFGFMGWKDYDESLWDALYDQAMSAVRFSGLPVAGSDISEKAIAMARSNASRTTLGDAVAFSQSAFADRAFPDRPGTIITNPPYDERLKVDDVRAFYRAIGNTLKAGYRNWNAWIISSSIKALKNVGLTPSAYHNVNNGPIACRFNRYDVY